VPSFQDLPDRVGDTVYRIPLARHRGGDGRFTGERTDVPTRYVVDAHLNLAPNATCYSAGPDMTAAGGRDMFYFGFRPGRNS